MAQKKKFVIETPRGCIFTQKSKNGETTAKLEWAPGFEKKKNQDYSKAQEFVDSECLRHMNPLTPRRTGVLIKSATLGTVIGSGQIKYLAPYGRRQYYEHKGGAGQRGAKWFERMKAAHKDSIMKGANQIAGGQ